MATTKTLTPTNETITIDSFQGEKPDYRHVADAETKLANAVNALNSQIAPSDYGTATRSSTYLSNGTCHYVKFGKIVLVRITEMVISTTLPSGGSSYSNQLFSGLPKAKSTGANYLINQYSTGASLRISLVNGTNDAVLSPHYDSKAASGGQWYGTFWYLAA